MEKCISREEAFQLLKKYNQDRFHIQHADCPMAQIKAESDVCVTSSNALKIVKKLPNMKRIKLESVLRALEKASPEVELDEDLRLRANLPLQRMLELSN